MNCHNEKDKPDEKGSINDESLLIFQLLCARRFGDTIAHFGREASSQRLHALRAFPHYALDANELYELHSYGDSYGLRSPESMDGSD